MSLSAGLTLIGVCLFGIMLFVIILVLIYASRYDYDKARATRKREDKHIREIIKKYYEEEQ